MTKLVFKVHAENRYAASKFPLKLRPCDDELLSSWLIRLALKHRTMPSTFTNLYLPQTRNKLWSADLDLQGNPEFIEALSDKSGIPCDIFQGMSLKSYEGFLFEKAYGSTGGTPFINPLGMRGRRNTLPGVRFCPVCLQEDEHPFIRKAWRLSYWVACPKHECFLANRCPECGTPITPYIAINQGLWGFCHSCNQNFIKNTLTEAAPADTLSMVQHLHSVVTRGYLLINDKPIYSHLYCIVVHQLIKLMLSRKYGPQLCEALEITFSEITLKKTFERLPMRIQTLLLKKAVWLLDEWPERFVAVCKQSRVLSSGLLRDLERAPFWYWDVINERLYRLDSR